MALEGEQLLLGRQKLKIFLKMLVFEKIDRVERFFGFCISGLDQSIDALDLSILYDRMTQDIYKSIGDCSSILNPNPKRLINHIDILSNGKSALSMLIKPLVLH